MISDKWIEEQIVICDASSASDMSGALSELLALRKASQWIRCDERMPEPLDWVIAYDEAGTVKAYICQHTGEWIRDNGDELYQVTHWQPLPSPPTE